MQRISQSLIDECRKLRKGGFTLGEIIRKVRLAKTTVYDHVRDIAILPATRARVYREATKRINEYNIRERRGKCVPGRIFFKPTRWSHELVYVLAHLLFDGRITRRGFEYFNRNSALYEGVRKAIKNLFGIDSKIFPRDYGVKQIRYYYVELGIYVQEKSSELLDYILAASREEKRIFLHAFFDDEGSIHFKQRIVRGFQHDGKILALVQRLLRDFNIESRIDSTHYEVVISRKQNLINFRDEIGFSRGIFINPERSNSIWKQKLEKREILDRAIASYQN